MISMLAVYYEGQPGLYRVDTGEVWYDETDGEWYQLILRPGEEARGEISD